jgi:methionyl-tRNA synthetase
MPQWEAEGRTAIALELAAAWLLARCSEPVLPRFAARLADALGQQLPGQWPELAELVAPGSPIALADQVFFSQLGRVRSEAVPTAEPAPVDEPSTSSIGASQQLLEGLIRELLQLEPARELGDRRLADLQVSSLEAVALQYQVLEHFGQDLALAELLGQQTVAQLAEQLSLGSEAVEVG